MAIGSTNSRNRMNSKSERLISKLPVKGLQLKEPIGARVDRRTDGIGFVALIKDYQIGVIGHGRTRGRAVNNLALQFSRQYRLLRDNPLADTFQPAEWEICKKLVHDLKVAQPSA